MPLSAKERMKKYRQRIKENPILHEEYLQRERERWKKRRDEGKCPKLISEMNEREKRKKRRYWKNEIQNRRDKKKQNDDLIRNASVFNSPPNSPDHSNNAAGRGRRRVQRDRAKAYKKIKKLEEELIKRSREADKYRKRFERLRKKKTAVKNKYKLRLIMKESKLRGKLKQQLLLHCVVAQEIKRKMKSRKLLNKEQKRLLSSVVSRKILKKYNLMSISNEVLGISNKRLKFNEIKETRNKTERFRRARNKNAISDKIKTRVCNYLEEDINSRMLPGKNDTITKNKIKKNKSVF